MKTLVRCALNISAAAALLVGCGGSQPPIGAVGTMPQNRSITTHADRGGSWMLPEAKEAKNEDLIYMYGSDGLIMLSYPSGKFVGTADITGSPGDPGDLCSDNQGNVFATFAPSADSGYSPSYVYEYAHGAPSVTQIIKISDFSAHSCAVNPATEDLAIAGFTGRASSPKSSLAIFKEAQGSPTFYSDADFQTFSSCAFDNEGNLFASGNSEGAQLAELPAGGTAFSPISLPPNSHGHVAWDGTYLAITISHRHGIFQKYSIIRVTVTGSSGSVVGETPLPYRRLELQQTWIQRTLVLSSPHTAQNRSKVVEWEYPSGGKPIRAKKVPQMEWSSPGITVSIVPTRKTHHR